ncbi:classical arabinogalactan protein 10-like [Salvia hispanica]|uniref:classical arabinogalactan protein 10-like n=1 Tax=Salvia hispanica TaxID=49212 RepID=UPI002009A69B|nr:classical arabinogalactan protein 10-like [Salvia hispanica]
MPASSSLKLFLLLALIATSCMAQAPSGAPTVSPTASPVSPPTSAPTPESADSPTPSPALAPGAPAPTADQTPHGNSAFSSRAVFGATAATAALVAVALI